VAGRRERNDAARSAGYDEGDEAVYEDEMPEVISAKLGLEPLRSGSLRAGHYARVRYEHIERLALRDQLIRARTYACQRREIKLD